MKKVSVVAVYIERGGSVLMVQEKGPAWGLWSIPVGHADEGEILEKAAKREVKEETGLDIEILTDLGKIIVSDKEYKGGERDMGKQIEINFFKGEIVSGVLKPEQEILLDAKWIEKNKIPCLPLRGEWLKSIIT